MEGANVRLKSFVVVAIFTLSVVLNVRVKLPATPPPSPLNGVMVNTDESCVTVVPVANILPSDSIEYVKCESGLSESCAVIVTTVAVPSVASVTLPAGSSVCVGVRFTSAALYHPKLSETYSR